MRRSTPCSRHQILVGGDLALATFLPALLVTLVLAATSRTGGRRQQHRDDKAGGRQQGAPIDVRVAHG
jgi:hypothetical protein